MFGPVFDINLFYNMFQESTLFTMRKWILACGLAVVCTLVFAQDRSDYIEQYKSIAISEMMRTGIPASIKLAQAMLESNCGKSDLACKANNHFGIKCGNDWNGKTFKKEDDDFDDGKLVKSCFREFRTVYDSYIAHSDFLIDPAKSKRYGSLFELDATDYKGWAKGLSKAGYATDPEYAKRLIDIIERYNLYQLDSSSDEQLASVSPESSTGYNLVRYHNDVKYTEAAEGDTPYSLAKRHDVTVKQIIRYNDDIEDESQVLNEGAKVYLQPKRNQNHGQQKVHLLKPGETLTGISQLYGIKLEALLKRNGLQQGEIPAPNQKILLKGKSNLKLRTINPYDIPFEKVEKPSTPVSPQNETASIENSIEVKPVITRDSALEVTNQTVKKETSHSVAKGETLYSIARQYDLSLAELKKMNNLSADTIFIGQKLIIK
jgi:LysM repeat protein